VIIKRPAPWTVEREPEREHGPRDAELAALISEYDQLSLEMYLEGMQLHREAVRTGVRSRPPTKPRYRSTPKRSRDVSSSAATARAVSKLPDAYLDPLVGARQDNAASRGRIYRPAIGTILDVR
jgi:hypothetical protein